MSKQNNGVWPDMDDLPVDDIQEQIIHIDLDTLDEDSAEMARGMVTDLNTLYGDEEILQKYPQTKARLDMELETLRGLIKMRKSDERAHDALLQAIAATPTNASLYRSLAEIQKTSLQVTTKINETIETINKVLKSFQQELDRATGKMAGADAETIMNEETDTTDTYRGSKAFIQAMNREEAV